VNDKATFLQGLLERVRRNAAKPRTPRAAATSEGTPKPVAAAPPPPQQPPPVVAARAPVVAARAPVVAAPAPPPIASPPEPPPIAPAPTAYHVPATPPVTEIVVDDADATVEVMELDEAEIVDITLEDEEEAPAAQAPAAAEVPERVAAKPPAAVTDIDFEDEDDRPPSSSRRPILATSLDEALTGAVDEHEVPIKTPPPESGPQEALPPAQVLQQKPLELDEPGMEAELAARSAPAPEQVGNTIELEEPAGPALELDSLPAESGPQPGRAADALEAELRAPSDRPARSAPPPTPVVEKAAESDAPELTSAVVPVSAPIPPPLEPPRVEQLIPPATARVEAEITPRSLPPNDVPVAAFARAHREFKPATFLELLDASLKLGG
jgi:hypothetical protein